MRNADKILLALRGERFELITRTHENLWGAGIDGLPFFAAITRRSA
jgi:hypothetical protein